MDTVALVLTIIAMLAALMAPFAAALYGPRWYRRRREAYYAAHADPIFGRVEPDREE